MTDQPRPPLARETSEQEALAIAVQVTKQNEDARDALPRRKAALTVLHERYKWSYQRLADALGITKSAVAAILNSKR